MFAELFLCGVLGGCEFCLQPHLEAHGVRERGDDRLLSQAYSELALYQNHPTAINSNKHEDTSNPDELNKNNP